MRGQLTVGKNPRLQSLPRGHVAFPPLLSSFSTPLLPPLYSLPPHKSACRASASGRWRAWRGVGTMQGRHTQVARGVPGASGVACDRGSVDKMTHPLRWVERRERGEERRGERERRESASHVESAPRHPCLGGFGTALEHERSHVVIESQGIERGLRRGARNGARNGAQHVGSREREGKRIQPCRQGPRRSPQRHHPHHTIHGQPTRPVASTTRTYGPVCVAAAAAMMRVGVSREVERRGGGVGVWVPGA